MRFLVHKIHKTEFPCARIPVSSNRVVATREIHCTHGPPRWKTSPPLRERNFRPDKRALKRRMKNKKEEKRKGRGWFWKAGWKRPSYRGFSPFRHNNLILDFIQKKPPPPPPFPEKGRLDCVHRYKFRPSSSSSSFSSPFHPWNKRVRARPPWIALFLPLNTANS